MKKVIVLFALFLVSSMAHAAHSLKCEAMVKDSNQSITVTIDFSDKITQLPDGSIQFPNNRVEVSIGSESAKVFENVNRTDNGTTGELRGEGLEIKYWTGDSPFFNIDHIKAEIDGITYEAKSVNVFEPLRCTDRPSAV